MTPESERKIGKIKAHLESHLSHHVDGKCWKPTCAVDTPEKVDRFWQLVHKDIERSERFATRQAEEATKVME